MPLPSSLPAGRCRQSEAIAAFALALYIAESAAWKGSDGAVFGAPDGHTDAGAGRGTHEFNGFEARSSIRLRDLLPAPRSVSRARTANSSPPTRANTSPRRITLLSVACHFYEQRVTGQVAMRVVHLLQAVR